MELVALALAAVRLMNVDTFSDVIFVCSWVPRFEAP